ncbi:UNVERIFIED_CONTAM: hypothetical protein Slati_0087900 [Sesamum latifolium]|uniref:Uncharacterized protein n=1 Tax=Sesamum latifolium TaxID=2727402 RepID=A0AAW2Y8A1_9LAMI
MHRGRNFINPAVGETPRPGGQSEKELPFPLLGALGASKKDTPGRGSEEKPTGSSFQTKTLEKNLGRHGITIKAKDHIKTGHYPKGVGDESVQRDLKQLSHLLIEGRDGKSQARPHLGKKEGKTVSRRERSTGLRARGINNLRIRDEKFFSHLGNMRSLKVGRTQI